MNRHLLSLAELQEARQVFEKNESRDLFYRIATELIDMALVGATKFTLSEALAVLLQTWNEAYYRYSKFDEAHFAQIEELLDRHREQLRMWRARHLTQLTPSDRDHVETVFKDFESVLGPVGAVKSLHLLAPRFFPLWDRKIAAHYVSELKRRGNNSQMYWDFMVITQSQVRHLGEAEDEGRVLKSIDEFNYCRYTKGWM